MVNVSSLPTMFFLWGFWDVLHLTFTLIVWIGEGVESAVAVVFPVTVWVGD